MTNKIKRPALAGNRAEDKSLDKDITTNPDAMMAAALGYRVELGIFPIREVIQARRTIQAATLDDPVTVCCDDCSHYQGIDEYFCKPGMTRPCDRKEQSCRGYKERLNTVSYVNGTDPIALYHAACEIRGISVKEISEIKYLGCDNIFDLRAADGCWIISDPEGSLVIFEDLYRVRVPAGVVK